MRDPYVIAGLVGFAATGVVHALMALGVLVLPDHRVMFALFGSFAPCMIVFMGAMRTHPDAKSTAFSVNLSPVALFRTAPRWALVVMAAILVYVGAWFYELRFGGRAPSLQLFATVWFAINAHLYWSAVTIRFAAIAARALGPPPSA